MLRNIWKKWPISTSIWIKDISIACYCHLLLYKVGSEQPVNLRGLPISLLIVPHSTLVNFLVFRLGKDSFRHRQKSLSPSNKGLNEKDDHWKGKNIKYQWSSNMAIQWWYIRTIQVQANSMNIPFLHHIYLEFTKFEQTFLYIKWQDYQKILELIQGAINTFINQSSWPFKPIYWIS